MRNRLNNLSTRVGFNMALRHFKVVNGFIKGVSRRQNLADLINGALDNKLIEQFQIGVILNALLKDKFQYYVRSFNINESVTSELAKLAGTLEEWTKLDMILSYYHPQLGQIIINPKDAESWDQVDAFKEHEYAVLFIGDYNNDFDDKLAGKCADVIIKMIHGASPSGGDKFKGETPVKKTAPKKVVKQPVQKQQQQSNVGKSQPPKSTGKKKKLTAPIGILVTNELFHNGNVEAWKKIIASYHIKYSELEVLVFYDNEQIHDINTLFKWGKVKHGTNIFIRVMGPEFKDISKLRRYLSQGASYRFEDFLKGPPGQILELF